MEVWTLENNKAKCNLFTNRDEANRFWKTRNEDKVPMITCGKKGCHVWNSTKLDWFAPMVEAESYGYDDSAEAYILSEVWEMTIFQTKRREWKTDPRLPGCAWEEGNNEWDVPFGGKKYRLTEEFHHIDGMSAEVCRCPEKYVEYTFWDGEKELSSFAYET